MPLAAPIGSGLGIQNPVNIRLIIEQANVPVLVDAGVGTASDAAIAMELGCDGVLMNTAIAEAKIPILMAEAMKHAVISGRQAYLAGRMSKRLYADPSSPIGGLIWLFNSARANLIAWVNSSLSSAPGNNLPLMTKAGVPFTPMASANCRVSDNCRSVFVAARL